MMFYFNISSDRERETDAEGMDLPSLDHARREARRAAREMVAEMVLHNEPIDGLSFEIADEKGSVLDVIRFRDVIRID